MKAFTAGALAVCAMVCAFAALPARSAGPASKPTPTPTPVAIAYDEITRSVIAPATAPPPGSFQPDYQLAMQNTSAGDTTTASGATPTPAPKKHGFGGLMSTVMNPMGAAGSGPNQGEAGPGGPPGGGMPGMNMMNEMKYGHVVRYTWYWAKNWVREDDPAAQTAVIHKCPQHQEIHLDLAKKTYTIVDTSQGDCVTDTQASGPGMRMGPGTVDMNLSTTNENLGPKTLEGIATQGGKNTIQMSMTNATGSCQNGQFAMLRLAYVSNIGKPRPYCPLTLGHTTGGFMQGGCKPTFHASSSGSINPMESDKLEMYLLTEAGRSADQLGQFSQVVERGHVDWYYKPQADALFEPPPDFTKAD